MKAWSAWKVTVFGPNAMPGGSGQMRHLASLLLIVYGNYLLHLILRHNIFIENMRDTISYNTNFIVVATTMLNCKLISTTFLIGKLCTEIVEDNFSVCSNWDWCIVDLWLWRKFPENVFVSDTGIVLFPVLGMISAMEHAMYILIQTEVLFTRKNLYGFSEMNNEVGSLCFRSLIPRRNLTNGSGKLLLGCQSWYREQ